MKLHLTKMYTKIATPSVCKEISAKCIRKANCERERLLEKVINWQDPFRTECGQSIWHDFKRENFPLKINFVTVLRVADCGVYPFGHCVHAISSAVLLNTVCLPRASINLYSETRRVTQQE
jgi:hypothetical protein